MARRDEREPEHIEGDGVSEITRLRARLAEANAWIDEATALVGPRAQNPPRPATIVKDEVDLGPPGRYVARGRIRTSSRSGYGRPGLALEFGAGEWIPESFPAEFITELQKQRPCPLWDTQVGPYLPFPHDVVPAPGVADHLRGLIVKRKTGSRLDPDAYVDPSAVGLPV